LRYDQRTQVVDAIPAPIIAHFLKDAEKEPYEGFPAAVLDSFRRAIRSCGNSLSKPAKRRRVCDQRRSKFSGRESGLEVGDIVLSVGNNEIDANGNYVDPLYGKIEFTNLITPGVSRATRFASHPARRKTDADRPRSHHRNANITSFRPTALITPKLLRARRYDFRRAIAPVFAGVGRELDEGRAATFCLQDRFQSELYPEGNRRVVVLTQVLPANTTIGYDDVAYLSIRKVNGKK